MNFNVYLNKETGERVSRMAKRLNRSRNSIIAEALEEWLFNHSEAQWPKDFFEFSPFEDVPDFKLFREELKDNINEDPLG
jgi:Ribbon-helix-helix protein, copG family